MKRERFFVHVYFSNETVFPDSRDDWTNVNVSFEARNYECLFQVASISVTLLKRSERSKTSLKIVPNFWTLSHKRLLLGRPPRSSSAVWSKARHFTVCHVTQRGAPNGHVMSKSKIQIQIYSFQFKWEHFSDFGSTFLPEERGIIYFA